MAGADLDTLIRSIARKQIKTLTVAAKQRRGHLMGMAAKATDKDQAILTTDIHDCVFRPSIVRYGHDPGR